MIKVKVVSNDDGDWYVIPADMDDLFSKLLNQMIRENYENQQTIKAFDRYFGIYTTGGCINNITLYADL